MTLLMSFGRTTFGSLYDIVPGSSDIFIRRFQMGVQLSGILLAGIGIVFLGRFVLDAAVLLFPEDRRGWISQPAGRGMVAALCIVALVVVLAPAWSSLDSYDAHNATNIGLQAEADTQQDPHIDDLLAYVREHPRGRVYAGLPTNWGADFLVGRGTRVQVPREQGRRRGRVHAAHGVAHDRPRVPLRRDQPGRLPALRHRVRDHPLHHGATGEADRVLCSDIYCLWALPDPGYIHVYDTTGVLSATRADVGSQSEALLGSPLLRRRAT